MSCRGCPHTRLGDMVRALRGAGYVVLRETRGCRGCVAEKAALVVAKAAGATRLIFTSGPTHVDQELPGSVVLWVHGPGCAATAICAAALTVELRVTAVPGIVTVWAP